VAAHSATFDHRFFVRECRRLRMSRIIEPFLCSMRLSRRIYPHMSGHSLGVLAHSLSLPDCGAAHRAAADAEVTAELMLKMGRDLVSMRTGMTVTTQLLRRLMKLPVARARTDLEKLCA
jgi:DNA polymerase-3 subunit epsilon